MGPLAMIPIIGKFLDKGLGVVDKLIPDKDKANELKALIKQQVLVNDQEALTKEMDAQMQIILAEARGGWMQRNWRPLLMLVIIFIIFNNYVLFPYFGAFTDKVTMLELPKGLWALLNLGVGGYIAGRSIEKIYDKKKEMAK